MIDFLRCFDLPLTESLRLAGWNLRCREPVRTERRIVPSKIRKPKPFRAASAVKAAARHAIGTPPPTRAEPASKKRKLKQDKHKPTLNKLLDEAGE